ncbi:hypothetical protein BB562_00370 [Lactiplantibacillus pentosus]|nr:hypothetical protein BB562_00370 [Lactiplantibacillus pentosus]MCT3063625.1 hypothetical protein [Lactiplantibacillus pentosus]MCT3275679.1 hypothetical protein [Lactiplantibacillus pentosus]MCT3282455.1 hypothetical protein [Lactiplantibacillus pentosus]PRO92216.1 hypothetical protein C6Y13_02035 [Lactiplantibacillus pentosus]
MDVAPRKVRMPMRNGGFHMQQSYVYRITSSGIEYLSMMQKVVEAESTVTAILRASMNSAIMCIL